MESMSQFFAGPSDYIALFMTFDRWPIIIPFILGNFAARTIFFFQFQDKIFKIELNIMILLI